VVVAGLVAPVAARDRGRSGGKDRDATTRVIGYLGALQERGQLSPQDLRQLARRWRSEHRLVNPISGGVAWANERRRLHHDGLVALLSPDVDGDVVARWADRTAAGAGRQRRARRVARQDTAIVHRQMELVRVEGGSLFGSRREVAPFTVQTGLVTQGQWATLMRGLPANHRPSDQSQTWRMGGGVVLRLEPDQPIAVRRADVPAFVAELNARRPIPGRRYDLPTEHELRFLLEGASSGKLLVPGGGSVSDLELLQFSWGEGQGQGLVTLTYVPLFGSPYLLPSTQLEVAAFRLALREGP
jgi:hypothetical protein